MTLDPGGLLGVAVLVSVLAVLFYLKRRRERASFGLRLTPEEIARQAEWSRKFDQENPPGPPLTEKEIAAIRTAYEALDRLAIKLEPREGGSVEMAGSRLGGPVWLERGEDWPAGKDAAPLRFLAQLDFSDMPHLEPFPTTGVMQFFIGRDDLFGMNIDQLDKGDIALRWRPNGWAEGVETDAPTKADDDYWPFLGDHATKGIALEANPVTSHVGWNDIATDRLFDGLLGRENIGDVEDAIYEAGEQELWHHVGGNAAFVQDDVRHDERYADFDTVLLRLTSDRVLQWGDVGEANFLIAREDLEARRFDRVLFTWDCS